MSRTDLRTILFDFFGTLVDYNPSRTGQGFPETHRIIGEMGGHLSYEEFVAVWDRTFSEYERRTALDDREFSMTDVATSVLAAAVDGPVRADEIEALIEVYLAEWSAGVRYLDDVAPLLADLSGDYRLGVLTNTHSAGLVPGHLAAMGVASEFAAVVTSVELGWRKPHPTAYVSALRALDADASTTLFVGDTLDADYLGPRAGGLCALLIDPLRRHDIPDHHRIDSVLDVPERLSGDRL